MAMNTTPDRVSGGADANRAQRIVIAGCGPGSPKLMTAAAREAAQSADVLVGTRRLLDLFPSTTAARISVGADIGAVLDRIAAIPSSQKIVVLVSGDPGLYSLARSVLARFGRSTCRVIAGISSVQAAFARIGVTWEDARLVSAHEAPPSLLPGTLAGSDKIAVLAGNRASAKWLEEAVKTLHTTHAVFICSDLALPEERVEEIHADRFEAAALPSRTVVLFVRKGSLQ